MTMVKLPTHCSTWNWEM